jgi:uncharacterized protein (TIGR02271 family)
MGRKDEQSRDIPVVKEELDIEKRQVETGKVRVRKVVREYEEVVDEPLVDTHVEVQRVAVNTYVDDPAPARREGETTIIPIHEEVTVVEKKLLLKEEIHITRSKTIREEPTTVTLRSEEAIVERDEDQRESGNQT